MNIGDRVRINSQSVWRNAFGVIVEINSGVASVRLIQPTRRPSYVNWTGYEIAPIARPIVVAEEHLEVVS